MSKEQPEIDWSLLPHDPVSFFKLEEGFNRRDLKKSYNKFLKLFKPEKFPEEFKKIRAAYEILEENLAYGHSMPSPQINMDDFEVEKEENKDSWEEIVQQNPEDISSLIENVDVQNPEKYIYGAFIEEAKNGEIAFINTILKGLDAFPDEYRIKSILERYLKEDNLETSIEDLINILDLNLSSSFFQLSEPLWFRLLQERGFEEFLTKFKSSKHYMSFIDPVEMNIFYVRLCKKFFFRLGEDFLEEHITNAEEFYEQLPYDTQQDLDFILSLREYSELQKEFLVGKYPYRKKIHRFFQNWCEDDDSVAHTNAMEFLSNQDHKAALDSFGTTSDKYLPVLRIFDSIVESIKYEIDYEKPSYNEDEKKEKVKNHLLYVETKTENSNSGRLRNLAYILFFAYHGFICAIPSIILAYTDNHPDGFLLKWGLYIGVFLGTGYFYLKIMEKFPRITGIQIIDYVDKHAYKKCWRGLMVDFIKDTGITDAEFAQIAHSIDAKEKNDISFDSNISDCMEEDIGIQIYATAIQFQ